KKQGKVKFLAASQHGGNTAEICAAMIESGYFDHLQPALSLNPTPAQLQMLELAKKHDVGIIAKKMMGSVGLAKRDPVVRKKVEAALGPDGKLGAAVIKAALTLPGVTAVTPLTRTFEMLNDNLTNGGIALTPSETRALAALRTPEFAPCNYCGECLARCPRGIPISTVLRYAAYFSVYGERRNARDAYRRLPARQRADQCQQCGGCAEVCPLSLPVPERLRRAHALLA
ncbi:MAG: 4Fe-4S dicluster domain-containing protein, partial [Armatimonadota bacterium]|nr:4Fe-4S dicluster domain-containing protein [Armatimonadota bacterium]